MKLILTLLAAGAILGPATYAQSRATIRHREANQQARVAQGVRSGELTPRETARIERQEARLNRELRRDTRDGGGLSGPERRKITRQQNRLSREIRTQKHDAQRVPRP